MTKSFTVRDLPEEERPRERLMNFGEQTLSAQELLQIVLGSGGSGDSVATLAQRLISAFGSVYGIAQASIEELCSVKGIGTAKATQLKAAFELGSRAEGEVDSKLIGKAIKSSEDVYKLLKRKIGKYSKEHFVVISLDAHSKVLGVDTVSVGTLNESIVHPRETFTSAIRRNANSVVLAHNHPSGNVEPSQADRDITNKLQQAGSILGIKVVDHVIVSEKDWRSVT